MTNSSASYGSQMQSPVLSLRVVDSTGACIGGDQTSMMAAARSSRWKRVGAAILDGFLAAITLNIGWFIWSMVVWTRGQSPAKQLLGMRIVNVHNGRIVGWGRMALREFVGKGIVAGLLVLPGYIWLISEILSSTDSYDSYDAGPNVGGPLLLIFFGAMLNYLVILFSSKAQGLHDMVASTLVVDFDPTSVLASAMNRSSSQGAGGAPFASGPVYPVATPPVRPVSTPPVAPVYQAPVTPTPSAALAWPPVSAETNSGDVSGWSNDDSQAPWSGMSSARQSTPSAGEGAGPAPQPTPAPTPRRESPKTVRIDDGVIGALVVTFVGEGGERRDARPGDVIGRNDVGVSVNVDLGPLPNGASVSHSHARVDRLADGWSVVDLGSTNGTFIERKASGRERVGPTAVRFGRGDTLRFGGVSVRVE